MCSGSLVLPRAAKTSEIAERGTEIHAFIRRVLRGSSRDASLALVPTAWKTTCAGIDFQRLVGDLSNVRSEIAFSLDVATDEVKELGQNIGRNYPPPPNATTIYGSSDIIGSLEDGTWSVDDVKTGYGDVTPPEENMQLLFFALILSLLHGGSKVASRLKHIRADGKVFSEAHVYDQFALDEYASKLVELVEREAKARAQYAATGTVDVHEGPWCTYCPARSSCPAKMSLMRLMLPELEAVSGKVFMMTKAEQGRAWELAHDRIAPLLESVLDSLKESAKEEMIPLPNGKMLAPSPQSRETFSTVHGIELLRKLGATDAQIDDCYRTTEFEKVLAMKAETAIKNMRKRA